MYYITTKSGVTPFAVLGSVASRATARQTAKELNGTVRTQEEYANLIADGKLPRTPVEPFVAEPQTEKEALGNMFTNIAAEVNSSAKVRETLGKKVKELKRPVTPPAVMAAASNVVASHLATVSKVHMVRLLAAFELGGVKLQRKDAMHLLAKSEIAAATISTQWQLVRAGKVTVK